jgi:hypothetical protein
MIHGITKAVTDKMMEIEEYFIFKDMLEMLI